MARSCRVCGPGMLLCVAACVSRTSSVAPVEASAAAYCPWKNETSGKKFLVECGDNTLCNIDTNPAPCCACNDGLKRCPPYHPHACQLSFANHNVGICSTETCVQLGLKPWPCPAPLLAPAFCMPPNAPPSPPKPPFLPAQHQVTTAMELLSAINDPLIPTIELMHSGSPFYLTDELLLSRNMTLSAKETVVLDAQGSADTPRRVMRVVAGAHVVLHNLVLTGAWTLGPRGYGGMNPGEGAVSNAGSLEMHQIIVEGNVAWLGAGIYTTGPLVLDQCIVRNNHGKGCGGGLHAGPGASVAARFSRFENNSAGGSEGAGGAACVEFAPASFTDCIFTGNQAVFQAGAIFLENELLDLTRCEIANNSAGFVGGGIQTAGSLTRLLMRDCNLLYNTALRGGALANLANNTNLTNVTIHGNMAHQGSGIFNSGHAFLVNDCDITGNTVPDLVGSHFEGIGMYHTGQGYLMGTTTIADNKAPKGISVQGINLYNGGSLDFHLPTKLAHYLTGVFKCQQDLCLDVFGSLYNCTVQTCEYESFKGVYMTHVQPGVRDDPIPFPCPNGFYASMRNHSMQSSSICEGECPIGHLCVDDPTSTPQPCPANHWCEQGKVAHPCSDVGDDTYTNDPPDQRTSPTACKQCPLYSTLDKSSAVW
eukprot:CAMPEP_0174697404 /NCGR_PEP_ID=MMETSP1094-20130205/3276_1 /TAXON_ID=156173 /ORGANISM="Chrysochromulina brevifilum, Strain UTEX LB 985" /LENGTH=649 /DNA_ID=CAMNT_0015894373 /DNA_START=36 /DNA_END=1982 /DNA_ORIENTATION=-